MRHRSPATKRMRRFLLFLRVFLDCVSNYYFYFLSPFLLLMEAKTKPDLGFWKLWNLSFGLFGVQIAYALQSANISRIFATLGADPHELSYFWILPPLAGLIIQPIVGTLSDRTWNRFGRRLPYLLFGAILAVIVMALLPNAGSFHFAVAAHSSSEHSH